MAAETPGRIEKNQIKHIVNTILDCAIPKPKWKNVAHFSLKNPESGTQTAIPPESRTRPPTWANEAAHSCFHIPKPVVKLALAQPLHGVRTDSRLMIRLRKNSPNWKEDPFILQKEANLVLPSNVIVWKVANINSGLAWIPLPETKLEQLEENGVWLAQAFAACRAEKNE